MARILVVEDDSSANKLISAVLRKDGNETLSATDGMQALDVLDREHVDLIISDFMMPQMDGMELTRRLRETEWNVPILMLTAKTGAEAFHAGFLAGADDLPYEAGRYEGARTPRARTFATQRRCSRRENRRRDGRTRPDAPYG